MKISVIIPCYNIEKYVDRCLDSVLNQTLRDIEVIVINDGSTDKTEEKIKDRINKNSKVKFINRDFNIGLIETRKEGFKLSNSEYVLFLDGDDFIEYNSLEILYNKAKEENSDIVMYKSNMFLDGNKSEFKVFDSKEIKNIENDPLKELFLRKIAPGIVFKFIKRDFIIKNNVKFPSQISYAEDLALTSSIFMNKCKLSFIEDKLYNYCRRSDSITKSKNDKVFEIEKAFDFIKELLIKQNIYEQYKYEYEYCLFWHLFLYRQNMYYDDIKIHKRLFNIYKSKSIDLEKNKYLTTLLESDSTLNKMMKLYDINYYVGRIYQYFRNKKIKKFRYINN